MHEQMTVLRPAAHSLGGHGISAFPPEVLEQVRGRVRLLSGLLLLAFAFDLVVYAGNWLAILIGYPAPRGFLGTGAFQVASMSWPLRLPPVSGGWPTAVACPRRASTHWALSTRSSSASSSRRSRSGNTTFSIRCCRISRRSRSLSFCFP